MSSEERPGHLWQLRGSPTAMHRYGTWFRTPDLSELKCGYGRWRVFVTHFLQPIRQQHTPLALAASVDFRQWFRRSPTVYTYRGHLRRRLRPGFPWRPLVPRLVVSVHEPPRRRYRDIACVSRQSTASAHVSHYGAEIRMHEIFAQVHNRRWRRMGPLWLIYREHVPGYHLPWQRLLGYRLTWIRGPVEEELACVQLPAVPK